MPMEKWIVDGPRVIDFDLVRSAKIAMIAGSVDVLTHDEPTARLEVHSVRGRDLKISIDGDHLEIDHPQLRWDNFIDVFSSFTGRARAEVSLLLPRTVALTLGVVTAKALVSGVHADARINTISGELVVDGCVGKIDANSVSGEVAISDHQGAAHVRTVSGDVTVSGELTSVGVDGVSADVVIDSSSVPDEVSNNTVSGALMVRVPAEAAAQYTLNTVSGTIQLDNLTIPATRGRGYSGKSGDLDVNFVEIRANSVAGDITVLHRREQTSSDNVKAEELA